jgi:sugar phosphate isomerase/epimerase
MIRPSIWTQVAAYFGSASLEESLTGLCELGWRCFELSTEHLQAIDESPDREARIERAVGLLARLGAEMPQAHGLLHADVANGDEAAREADLARLNRNLDTCAAIGVGVVVVHPGQGGGYATDAQYRDLLALNVRQLTRLADRAGQLGLRIAVENMADAFAPPGRRRLGATCDDLLELLAALDHPAAGICFDTSHANLQRLDLFEAIGRLGPHIIATHVSDNDGTGDQHRTPGYGQIDWPAVAAAFGEIGYAGPMNLEIPGESCCGSAELVRMKVRHALAVAEWLVARSRDGRPG